MLARSPCLAALRVWPSSETTPFSRRSAGQEQAVAGKLLCCWPPGVGYQTTDVFQKFSANLALCERRTPRDDTLCALTLTAWAQASLGLVNVEAKPPETTAPPPPPPSIQRDPGSTATGNNQRRRHRCGSIAERRPRPEEGREQCVLCVTRRLPPTGNQQARTRD